MRGIRYFIPAIVLLFMVAATQANAEYEKHYVRYITGPGSEAKIPAQFQFVSRNWGGPDYGKEVNGAIIPNLIYMPEKNRLLMMFAFGPTRTPWLTHSDDWGKTWSAPSVPEVSPYTERIKHDWSHSLTYLGKGRAVFQSAANMNLTDCYLMWYSNDFGQTWGNPTSCPRMSNGHRWANWDPMFVETDPKSGKIVRLVQTGFDLGVPEESKSGVFIRFSKDAGKTWHEEIQVPQWKGLNEINVHRAKNGNIVAACRTGQPARFQKWSCNDHRDGLAVSVSKDNGSTWSEPNRLYDWGRHYPSLVTLPTGEMVLTYVVRLGYCSTNDGRAQYGVEAVVSYDNGETWDLDHKYILANWVGFYGDASPQSTSSVALPNGSIVTAYGTGQASSPERAGRNAAMVHWRLGPKPAKFGGPITSAYYTSNLRNEYDPAQQDIAVASIVKNGESDSHHAANDPSPQDITLLSLVKNGKSDYAIVLSQSASLSEQYAAEELQSFLEQITGAKLPVVSDTDGKPAGMILLGDSARLRELNVSIDYNDLGGEGFVIKTLGPHLVISGGRQRGTMYGTYAFLEEVLGCRWYSPNCSYIPKKSTITLGELDITQKPDFEYRDVSTSGRLDPDWCARNRINGSDSTVTEKQGGRISYHQFVHTFRTLVPEEEYFKDHPEYYSLVDGKRRSGWEYQLCLSNPNVLKISMAQVLKWCEENPAATIISVSQNDNYRKCECDECKAEYEKYGSPSGQLLRFVNTIADEVAKKYPDKLIDTLAYHYTEIPPKGIRPRPNVCIRLAPIVACQYHVFGTCEKNTFSAENLRAWNQICDRIYVWHYVTNFRNILQPYPDFDQLIGTIPFYKKNGVRGLFAQGEPWAADECGGSAWVQDLRQYLLAKMMWNTQVDAKKVMDDFLHGYYGNVAEHMKQSIKLFQDKVLKDNIHGYFNDPSEAAFLTPDIMVEQEYLFDEAERLAESEEIRRRVKHTRLSLDYVYTMHQMNLSRDDVRLAIRHAALDIVNDLAAKCASHGIRYWAEGRPMGEMVADLNEDLRLVAGFAKTRPTQAHYLDGGLYYEALDMSRTVLKLPLDGWAFKGDNENVGEQQGYFKQGFDDKDFDKIRVDTIWNNQGYPNLTYGWYRLKFKAPQLPEGKKVYLRFEAIDESAWVYLDGELAAWYDTADPDNTWKEPVMFNVTNHLKSGQEHLLAVKVHNILAAGGIWQPVSVMVEK